MNIDTQTLIIIAALVVIILAISFSGNVRGKIGNFFSIGTASKKFKNRANIDGEDHKVEQGLNSKNDSTSTVNKLKMDGKGNEVKQG